MVQINFAKREVQCKVVYYGPARSGKTANLRSIHARTPERVRGALTTIATDQDRTLFFDFLPLNLGLVAGIATKINLYAVPYITNQNATRLLVLEGIDGIVFVADSQAARMADNIEALENLRQNLADLGREIDDIPVVFQWNKSESADALAAPELAHRLNPRNSPAFPASADSGAGVVTCLKSITQAVLVNATRAVVVPVQAPVEALVQTPTQSPVPPAPLPEPTVNEVPQFDGVLTIGPDAPAPEPETVPAWHEETDPAVLAQEQTGDFEPDAVTAGAQAQAVERREALQEATSALAQPGNYDQPPPAQPQGRPASAGGRRAAPRLPNYNTVWEDPAAEPLPFHGRAARPVVERRREPRLVDSRYDVPLANIAAGAICALVSLVAIGYLVHALL